MIFQDDFGGPSRPLKVTREAYINLGIFQQVLGSPGLLDAVLIERCIDVSLFWTRSLSSVWTLAFGIRSREAQREEPTWMTCRALSAVSPCLTHKTLTVRSTAPDRGCIPLNRRPDSSR